MLPPPRRWRARTVTLGLLALTIVYGIVHGIAFMRRRSGAPQPVLLPQTDLAILNWRREKTVFLGTNQPQEDASWIFQLRMAELERAGVWPEPPGRGKKR